MAVNSVDRITNKLVGHITAAFLIILFCLLNMTFNFEFINLSVKYLPHDINYIVYCLSVCLWVTPSMKLTKFGSRYLAEGFSEGDEIW